MPKNVQRRLAAILAADVVGYSRLIRADEEGTLAALKILHKDLIDPKIAEHHGRVVKLMGDGMLAEFGSVVDAVRAAAEVQHAIAERNANLPEEQRMVFRVGINLGDVVIDGDDIHGDGINVAARLEGLAAPGGICISAAVYDQVRDRLELAFEDLGEQEVKNIDRPVRVWRWTTDASVTTGGLATADKQLSLPDKPSIAVLSFVNMSGDPEQEFFSDGMAEEIITALSRYRWFFVIARNSSFTYKGRAVDVTQVGQELGVRYVLEGSVRKAGNRVRVTAQLIDATTGNHIWAERYDRELDDIFALQDEITETIVAAVEPELGVVERERARRKRPENLGAWGSYQRGLWHLLGDPTRDALAEARRLFQHACELDPEFAAAYADLAWTHTIDITLGLTDDLEAS
ncbi:MAG: adenylate/guanylate cyclase domain-containing protein, partial [Planctomycetota bacterium]